jgi:hypothetical protein
VPRPRAKVKSLSPAGSGNKTWRLDEASGCYSLGLTCDLRALVQYTPNSEPHTPFEPCARVVLIIICFIVCVRNIYERYNIVSLFNPIIVLCSTSSYLHLNFTQWHECLHNTYFDDFAVLCIALIILRCYMPYECTTNVLMGCYQRVTLSRC